MGAGAWGALEGFGKGMLGYADIMKEQQKHDWETQAEEVKFKRQMALEDLRNTRTRENTKYASDLQQGNWKEQYGMQQTSALGKELRERTYKEEDLAAQEAMQGRLEGRRMANERSLIGARSQAELDAYEQKKAIDLIQAGALASENMRLTDQQKKQQIESLKGNPAFNQMDEKSQNLALLAISVPEVVKMAELFKDQKVSNEVIEQASQNFRLGYENYFNLPEETRDKIDAKAAKAGEDPAVLYGMSIMQKTPGIQQLTKGKGQLDSQAGKTRPTDQFDPDRARELRSAFYNGSITFGEAKTKLKGTPYEPLIDEFKKGRKQVEEKQTEEQGPSMIDRLSQFGSRNTPGGYNDLFQKVKSSNPNMTDKAIDLEVRRLLNQQ